MTQHNLRYRYVHLDFHTAPQAEKIGADFDPDVFGDTLKDAKVNAINIFGKCHHGYSYYPTKVGTVHPNLDFDLLGGQIEALKKRDIFFTVYVSVIWDELAGKEHPEWVVVDKEGKQVTRPPLNGDWGWTSMDVSSGYFDYLAAQTEEIIDMYDVDGMWFDICFALANYSTWGQAQMLNAGVNIEDDAAVWAFAEEKQRAFLERMTKFVHQKLPKATIFYNGTMKRDMRRLLPHMTHLEVESLPTTAQWGYLHYPTMGRQARTYGKDFIGMNGRFHTWWGDFGGLKTDAQMEYEVGTVLATGGKLCVGDQLHPNGVLDPAVYRMIGTAYERVEALEPFMVGAKPTAELALLALGEIVEGESGIGAQSPDIEGMAQMLIEMGYQFDVIDVETEFSSYPALFIPDGAVIDADLKARLEAFVSGGGKLIWSGKAGLDENGQFVLDHIPAHFKGDVPTVPSYLRPDAALIAHSELADDYDYVFYDQAYLVEAAAGTTSYGNVSRALFTRTWKEFMGHQHAPVGESLGAPIMVKNDTVLYLAVPLGSGYRNHDYWSYREMVRAALLDFLDAPLLKPQAPGWVEMTLLNQEARQIVHVVTYQPRRTWQNIQHVDQAWAVSGMSVAVKADAAPSKVYTAPENEALTFSYADGYVQIDLPPSRPHLVVVLER